MFFIKNTGANSVHVKFHLLIKLSFHIEDINDIKSSK